MRAFFCDDTSIKYPFKESTVPAVAVYASGILISSTIVGDAAPRSVTRVCCVYIFMYHYI